MTSGSSSAWLRHGEIQAANVSANAHSPADVEKVLVGARELTKEACPSVFVPALQTSCAGAGVVVVFTPELKGCGVSGVTRWRSSGHALIQLSLRYKTDDHLWFTFFHEAGHVVLHPKKRTVFLDGDGGSGSPDEDDANRFATDHLLAPGAYAAFVAAGSCTTDAIKKFAGKAGVSPGIVVGRLQHDRHLKFDMHEGLKARFAWKRG